jgi:predicted DNA-binding transcriptional regulator AlpA
MRKRLKDGGTPRPSIHAPPQHGQDKGRSYLDALYNFDSLPDSAVVTQPVVEGLFTCSPSTVWRRVKSGLIPKPKKVGLSTVWSVGELKQSLNKIKAEGNV